LSKGSNGKYSPVLNGLLGERDRMDLPDENADISQMTPEELAAWQDSLVRANARYAVSMVGTYEGYGVPTEDVIGAALLGMTMASKKYDPSRDAKFITYANFWCRAEIHRMLAVMAQDVRLPFQVWFQKNNQDDHREHVAQARVMTAKMLSMDMELGELDDVTLHDVLSHDHGEQADEAEHESLFAGVRKFLDELDPRSAQVVREYYGIGTEQRSLEDMKHDYGLSRERMRQIREEALTLVRDNRGGQYDYLWARAEDIFGHRPELEREPLRWRWDASKRKNHRRRAV
jgi:RNA polymerase primary sigma factor